jgi:hypothetical protein
MNLLKLLTVFSCFQMSLIAQNTMANPTADRSQYQLTVPTQGNSWVVDGISSKVVDSNGISSWNNSEVVIRTYFYAKKPCKLTMAIDAKVESGSSTIKFSFENETKLISINNNDYAPVEIGTINIKYPGYYFVDMQGVKKEAETFAKIKDLLLGNEADSNNIKFVNEDFYFGRRGPSVHLSYQIPSQAKDIEWFYNEVEVNEGQDAIGSYFMANGFGEGYFGMQVNSPTERRILFSVWSSFNTDDPKNIPDDEKIKMLKKGENVNTGEFGNEGSGGQSLLRYNWKAGIRYKFLLHGKPSGNNTTTYTAYFYDPQKNEWKLIASFMRPKTNTYLKGFHSFLENFIPDQGVIDRKCGYFNQWVADKDGKWYQVNKAVMTADNTAHSQRRFDFSGGTDNAGFYLRMGGFINDNTRINNLYVRPQSTLEPKIDFKKLK